ncbi:MAG: hypothetical protein QNJ89_12540 [Acidimicrobiia bacterium]|nr:hypothetical protein [Acidimicrobiia bacterium]
MTWLLAHQGGWDEFLLFAGPIALAVVIMVVLERRRPPQTDESQEEPESQNTTP